MTIIRSAMTYISSAVRTASIGIAILLISTVSHATELMTGVQLIEQINSILEKNHVDGTALVNPEQKFINCRDELSINPLYTNWKTLKLTCPTNDQWRLLVRVKMRTAGQVVSNKEKNLKAKAIPLPKPKPQNIIKNVEQNSSEKHLKAVALNRSMTKGEVITAADLVVVAITRQQNTGIFTNIEDLVGRRVKTAIHTNKPIYSHQLEPYYMVEQKKPVTIAFSHQGIYVEMSGVSLENGQFGQIIKVENISSGKTVFGKVIGSRKISPIH